MHHSLTKTLRRWGTALLVAAYALGVLGPAVAFAYADRAAITHVLNETHGGTLIPHFHHDGDRHDDSGKAGSKFAHHCCGVTALVGLEPAAGLVALQPAAKWTRLGLVSQSVSGLGAFRLDRPPR